MENHQGSKSCSHCKKEQPLNNFHKGRGKSGRKNYCKACSKLINAKNYINKRSERIKVINNWNKAHPEKMKQYQEKFKQRNKLT